MDFLTAAGLGLDHDDLRFGRTTKAWCEAGVELRDQVADALAGLAAEVQVIGSTSVLGLLAKPIVDLAVGLTGAAFLAPVTAGLKAAGWIHRGDAGDQGGHVFVLESRPWHRVAHLHVVDRDSDQWRDYLRFRDLLRRSPEARERYEAVKLELAERESIDRKAYTFGKTSVVTALVRESREEPDIERPLAGGFVSGAVRVGDTVRKLPPRDPEFVRRLLRHFEERRWDGAPRFLGTDAGGRETLSFVDGSVPWQRGDESSLAAVAGRVREFHDLTAGTSLAGYAEVVCHNDLSPRNTVHRGAGLPVVFIDWDLAAPGERIHDVAHVCWQFVGLGPGIADVAAAARLVRVVAEAYGLEDRSALIDTVLWWQDRCRRGIEAGAEAGDAAMIRLRDLGTVDEVRAAHDWTRDHRDQLRH